MRVCLGGRCNGAAGVGIVCWVGMAILMPGCRRAEVPQGCTTCADAKQVNGWCDACTVGYVAGLPIKSNLLYETMDAHGHTLQVELMPCEDCRRMSKSGGYCEKSRIGWHRGEAYFSRLTYEIARGRYCSASDVECDTCYAHYDGVGWCDACKRGIVGRFAITNRDDFDAAHRDFERLLKAITLSETCDYCAMAIVTDTACFKCKIAFQDGVALGAQSSKCTDSD